MAKQKDKSYPMRRILYFLIIGFLIAEQAQALGFRELTMNGGEGEPIYRKSAGGAGPTGYRAKRQSEEKAVAAGPLIADFTTAPKKKNTDELGVRPSSQISVEPAAGSCRGGCDNQDYFVQINGAEFGNGWDITKVTICGVEVCQIVIQSANSVVVYPGAGTPGTGDIVITSKSKGKTTIKNGFTYLVATPDKPVKEMKFSKISGTSIDINWKRGGGESCVVFVKEANGGFATPSNQISYQPGAVFGKGTQIGTTGWFCVYNGNGTSVSVSGLTTGKDYVAQVFEYNGQAGFETYLIVEEKHYTTADTK